MLRKLSDRRQLGAYYTPSTVAEILCSWAITSPQNFILEPSFGGCEFLDSSIRRLEDIGCTLPEKQVFGCDIDTVAFHHLNERPRLLNEGHFLQRDFLQVTPADFSFGLFDVIVGNPPYVRHQNLSSVQKIRAREIRQTVLPKLNLQASLWALFLIHSTRFLAEGGRFAWLLPPSFLYSDYAKALRSFVRRYFEEVRVVKVDERLFEKQGAAEGTVVLAAAGWDRKGLHRLSTIKDLVASSIEDLRSALFEKGLRRSADRGVYERLKRKSVRLGKYCSFQIGVVTGDTSFFLFNKERAVTFGISSRNLPYVLPKSSSVPGLFITTRELRRAYKQGARVKIFNPPVKLTADAVSYLSHMPSSSIKANLTFNKRRVWYRPLDGKKADAFFTCMSHHGPRLILNQTTATCTNSLYRVKFKRQISERTRRILAISLLSSFSQLSAERVGRAYSAGMLKHEPSDASDVLVLLPPSSVGLKDTFAKVDAFVRSGDVMAARRTADEFLIANSAIRATDCDRLNALLLSAREGRMIGKRKVLDHTENSII